MAKVKNPVFARSGVRYSLLVSKVKMSRRTASKMMQAQKLPKAVLNWMGAAELAASLEGGHPWEKLEEMREISR